MTNKEISNKLIIELFFRLLYSYINKIHNGKEEELALLPAKLHTNIGNLINFVEKE